MRSLLVPVLSVTLIGAACSGGPDDGPVTAAIDRIPADVARFERPGGPAGAIEVSFADFARAAELAGLPEPGPRRDETDILTSLVRLTDPRGDAGDPFVFLPTTINQQAMADPGAMAAETGWSLGAAETVTEVSAGFGKGSLQLAVLTGELQLGGELAQDGDIWRAGEGEDFEFGPASPLREFGWPLFFASDDDAVAMANMRAVAEDWADGGRSLADEDSFAAIAEALDRRDPYTAKIFAGPFGVDPAAAGPEVPFTHAAVAEFDDDGTPRTMVAYLYQNDDQAAGAVESLRDTWLDVESLNRDELRPLDLEGLVLGVDASADGSVVTVVLEMGDNANTELATELWFRSVWLSAS